MGKEQKNKTHKAGRHAGLGRRHRFKGACGQFSNGTGGKHNNDFGVLVVTLHDVSFYE